MTTELVEEFVDVIEKWMYDPWSGRFTRRERIEITKKRADLLW